MKQFFTQKETDWSLMDIIVIIHEQFDKVIHKLKKILKNITIDLHFISFKRKTDIYPNEQREASMCFNTSRRNVHKESPMATVCLLLIPQSERFYSHLSCRDDGW